jgi:PST family polysaccharide transporter
VIEGTSWNVASQISVQVLAIGVTIVLARLLNPEDFGVVAIANVFFGFAYLFADLGMGMAVIQRSQVDDEYLSTAFWASVIAGLGIAIIYSAAAPAISWFYDKDILRSIVLLSSAGFILGSLTSVHTSMLRKRLEFDKIALIGITSKVISGISSIGIALLGFGIWSLVLGGLIAQVLMIPFVWYLVRWTPRLAFSKRCFKDMFGFSSNLLAFNFFNYFARNFDNLLVGKVLGAQTLGYYSLAYNVMLKPLTYISWSIGTVLFPVLSSIQTDKERVRLAYLRVVRSISLITFPMMTGLMIVSREFVLALYGPKWEPVVLPLQLLCAVGAMQSIGTTVGTVFNSQGRSDLQLKWGVFASCIYIIAFLIGVQWGLIGLIVLYVAVGVPLWPLSHVVANKLIDLDMKTFSRAMVPAATASVFMAMALLSLKYIGRHVLELNIYSALAALVTLGIILYGVFLQLFFKVPEIDEVKKFLRRKITANLEPTAKVT